MKKLSLLFVILALFTLLPGCIKHDDGTPADPCAGEAPTVYTSSVNMFDLTAGSPYFNQVVASFAFAQTQKDCPSFSSSTDLIIQNNTSKSMSLDYNINFSLNLIHWNNQGVATIAPFSSYDAGVINTNPGRVDLGAISIQSAHIAYQ